MKNAIIVIALMFVSIFANAQTFTVVPASAKKARTVAVGADAGYALDIAGKSFPVMNHPTRSSEHMVVSATGKSNIILGTPVPNAKVDGHPVFSKNITEGGVPRSIYCIYSSTTPSGNPRRVEVKK